MSERADQRAYWNNRVSTWGEMDVPLIPDKGDIEFHKNQMKPGGDTLVLGVTPQLCSLALGISGSVVAVDFAEAVIKELRMEGINYVHSEWLAFLEQSDATYDNILTDGGLLCLDFPASWERIADQIRSHLKPGGVFTARVYVNTQEPPRAQYSNPNLNRFVTSMGLVDKQWMVHPKHGDYAAYDMYYAFPPAHEVLQIFNKLALVSTRVPEYEEGQRFVSYAWRRDHD